MPRAPIRVVALLAGAAVLSIACADEDDVSAVETPELRAVPAIAEPARASKPSASTGETEIVDIPEIRVGSFERPGEARVPEYEVIEREPADMEGARAVRLLVDTHARTEAELEVIAQDLKALHADYDAVSVEFTDTSDVLDYNGAAVIFNTPAGAQYIGFVYGPPNNRGYFAEAAE